MTVRNVLDLAGLRLVVVTKSGLTKRKKLRPTVLARQYLKLGS